jgi:hypothetical protein
VERGGEAGGEEGGVVGGEGKLGRGRGWRTGPGTGRDIKKKKIISPRVCSKSHTYPVSSTATYTSFNKRPRSSNLQGIQLAPKILFFHFHHYSCPLYNRLC